VEYLFTSLIFLFDIYLGRLLSISSFGFIACYF